MFQEVGWQEQSQKMRLLFRVEGGAAEIRFIPKMKWEKKNERRRQDVHMGSFPCSNNQWHEQESI